MFNNKKGVFPKTDTFSARKFLFQIVPENFSLDKASSFPIGSGLGGGGGGGLKAFCRFEDFIGSKPVLEKILIFLVSVL